MTTSQALLAFIVAASILTVTPGVDTAMVLRSAATAGPRAAISAGLGICIGCLVWGGAVALGLGALLAASPLAYAAVTWAGAAYLIWLGAGLLLRPRESLAEAGEAASIGHWQALRQGLFTNLLNPKIGVFYITFLPQFVPAGADVASFTFLLAAIHVALSLLWFAMLILATMPMARLLRRPRFVTAMDRVTGGIFIAFGARLALSARA
ncbi:MAG: hypothetical protein RIS17_1536 [Pseudomonadota bacterium]|jgi:threonine/homoserine/homoserine lactone efflux protein